MSAIGCKNKFKNLHDTYRRLVHSEKLPSGSASKDNVYKWRHFKTMEFLRDSCLQKRYIMYMTLLFVYYISIKLYLFYIKRFLLIFYIK